MLPGPRSYGLWLNNSNHRVKQVDISESTDINKSISMNRFYPIFSTHVRRVCYSNK